MAQNLDLEEQEQLDQIKHFWKQYGTLITSALAVVLVAMAAWLGYQSWQQKQGAQASALYDELDRAAKAGDIPKLEQSLADLRDKYGKTVSAQQAGLLAGKVLYEKGNMDGAKAALSWVAEKANDDGLRALARLRLAAIFVEEKAYEEALKQLGGNLPTQFAGLVADRRGDVYLLQGKPTEATAEFTKAYKALGSQTQYRKLVGLKLNSLGINPDPDVSVAKADEVRK